MKLQVLPTAVSLANFLCGFASITYSLKAMGQPLGAERETSLYFAAMLVFFAMVADLLDGKIARMTGGESDFGAEIDSLSDVVSFGVAPAVLVVALSKASPLWDTGHLHRAAWVLAGAYAAFTAMRLARYNVEKSEDPGDTFWGLPSPSAAGAVVSLALLYLGIRSQDRYLSSLALGDHAQLIIDFLPVYTLLVGVLMVTRVRYSALGRKVLSGKKPFAYVVVLTLIAVITFMQMEATLAAGFTLYLVAGLVIELVAILSGKSVPEATEAEGPGGGVAAAARGDAGGPGGPGDHIGRHP